MLSILCFVTRITQFCGTDLAPMVLTVGTNSESLITRVENETAQKTIHLNDTLVADWDITHEIQHNLGSHTFRTTIEHVRGHQDLSRIHI